jgi:hypothetical protein
VNGRFAAVEPESTFPYDALEHVAKKWIPVLRTKTCVVNNLEHAF